MLNFIKRIFKASIIIFIILVVAACGFRQHEQRMINKYNDEARIQNIIAMNTPQCNPKVADCSLITGGF